MMIHTITAGLYDSLIVDLEAHSNNSDLDTLLVINSCSSKSPLTLLQNINSRLALPFLVYIELQFPVVLLIMDNSVQNLT